MILCNFCTHETTLPMPPCGTCTKLLSNHIISHLISKLLHHGSLPHIATQTFFSTVPFLIFLVLAFIMITLLHLFYINFTSSTFLSWLSISYQTGMQVFYITPAFLFWLIIVSSVSHLSSFLDRFSVSPPPRTKFHHYLSVWVHSAPVTPGSRPFLSSLWRHYMSWDPPKRAPQVLPK